MIALWCVLWCSWVAQASEPVVERQVLSAVRAIAYDRKLPERAGQQIQIAVIRDGPSTHDGADRIEATLQGLGAFTIHDLQVELSSLDVDGFLASPDQVDVALLAPGGSRTAELAAAAAEHQVLTAGFAPDDIERGIAFVVVPQGDRFGLVVDLDASRAAGASFSSQLLKLAEVRR